MDPCIKLAGLERVGEPRQGTCCSGHLVLGTHTHSLWGQWGRSLGWGGSLRRWDDPGLGHKLGAVAWDDLICGAEGLGHVIRELGRGHRGAG